MALSLTGGPDLRNVVHQPSAPPPKERRRKEKRTDTSPDHDACPLGGNTVGEDEEPGVPRREERCRGRAGDEELLRAVAPSWEFDWRQG